MYLHSNDQHLQNTIIATLMIAAFIMLQLLVSPPVSAVEELSAQQLKSHCALLDSNPEGSEAQHCIRYIQGFIDGAVAIDARVKLNAEDEEETFTERAKRTRLPSNADRFRTASLVGFCLGDPLPVHNVVEVVVADLADISEKAAQSDGVAMEFVYASLQRNYPCEA